MNRRLKKSCLKAMMLAATTLAGLATVPTRGEDAHLERPKPRVQLTGADRWRLRPTQAPTAAPVATGSLRARPATAIPEERRAVRQVYPALVAYPALAALPAKVEAR